MLSFGYDVCSVLLSSNISNWHLCLQQLHIAWKGLDFRLKSLYSSASGVTNLHLALRGHCKRFIIQPMVERALTTMWKTGRWTVDVPTESVAGATLGGNDEDGDDNEQVEEQERDTRSVAYGEDGMVIVWVQPAL